MRKDKNKIKNEAWEMKEKSKEDVYPVCVHVAVQV